MSGPGADDPRGPFNLPNSPDSPRPSGAIDPLDSLGLWRAAWALPEQMPGLLDGARRALTESAALATGRSKGAGLEPPDLRAVAACGLGTDAIAARGAAALCAPHLAVPFWVGEDSSVPLFVDERTLFVALSCRGDTEEVLSAASEAASRGARVVSVGGDAGSPLATLAEEVGFSWCPLATGGPARQPGQPGQPAQPGQPGPRTVGALAADVLAVLAILALAGLVPDPAPAVEAAASSLARRRDHYLASGGLPAELARRLGRTIPVVYGAEGVGSVAARWWKSRVNLNAKAPAFAGVLPAVSHDEVSGWGQGGDVTRQVVSLVLLQRADEAPALAALFASVRQATDEVMADVLEVHATGEDDLAQLLDLALLGELVSLHLAAREGVDPGPVPAVEESHEAARGA